MIEGRQQGCIHLEKSSYFLFSPVSYGVTYL